MGERDKYKEWQQAHALNESQIKEIENLYKDCIENEVTYEKAMRLGELLSIQDAVCNYHPKTFQEWMRENVDKPTRSAWAFIRYFKEWNLLKKTIEFDI